MTQTTKPRLVLCPDIPVVYPGEYGSKNPDRYGPGIHTLVGIQRMIKRGKFKDLLVKRRVRSIAGGSERTMIMCNIRLDGKLLDALADVVTGTCYDDETGLCYSSNQIRIIA